MLKVTSGVGRFIRYFFFAVLNSEWLAECD